MHCTLLYVALLVAVGLFVFFLVPLTVGAVLLALIVVALLFRWPRPIVQWRPLFQLETPIFLGVLLALAYVLILPLTELVAGSFTASPFFAGAATDYGLAQWRFVFSNSEMLETLRNSAGLMLTRQAIALPISILLAWLITTTDMPGRRRLELFFWVALFVPSIAILQGWVILADPSVGLLNQAWGKLPFGDGAPFNIYSSWGIVWVQSLTKTIPAQAIVLAFAFRRMSGVLTLGLPTSGSDRNRALTRITLLALVPAVIFSEFWVAQDSAAELLLGTPSGFLVIASKIFQLVRFSDPPNYGAGVVMGVTVLIAVVPLLVLFRRVIASQGFVSQVAQSQPLPFSLAGWRRPAAMLVASLGLLMTLVPVVSLLVASFMTRAGYFGLSPTWTTAHWNQLFDDQSFRTWFGNTAEVAGEAAALSTLAFLFLAYLSARGQPRVLRQVTDALTWLPFAFPGVVLGLAWLFVLLRPELRDQYGTTVSLTLVSPAGIRRDPVRHGAPCPTGDDARSSAKRIRDPRNPSRTTAHPALVRRPAKAGHEIEREHSPAEHTPTVDERGGRAAANGHAVV